MTTRRRQMRAVAAALAVLPFASVAPAQEAGWHFSPVSGEGDRAALGCAYGSTATSFTCLAVRCEDDFSTGLYIHTSRPGGDAGRWRLTVDEEQLELTAVAAAPYHAKVTDGAAAGIDRVRNGAVAYLHPLDGAPVPAEAIPLTGSFAAIGGALYYCAPRVPTSSASSATASSSAAP